MATIHFPSPRPRIRRQNGAMLLTKYSHCAPKRCQSLTKCSHFTPNHGHLLSTTPFKQSIFPSGLELKVVYLNEVYGLSPGGGNNQELNRTDRQTKHVRSALAFSVKRTGRVFVLFFLFAFINQPRWPFCADL